MESGRRRLRSCLARMSPGGLGSPSVLIMKDCPQGLDAGRMKAAKACRIKGANALVRPRKHGPEAKNRRGGAPKGVRAFA